MTLQAATPTWTHRESITPHKDVLWPLRRGLQLGTVFWWFCGVLFLPPLASGYLVLLFVIAFCKIESDYVQLFFFSIFHRCCSETWWWKQKCQSMMVFAASRKRWYFRVSSWDWPIRNKFWVVSTVRRSSVHRQPGRFKHWRFTVTGCQNWYKMDGSGKICNFSTSYNDYLCWYQFR